MQGEQLVVRHDATTEDIGPALSMDKEEGLMPGAFNTLTNSLAQAPVNESCVEQDSMNPAWSKMGWMVETQSIHHVGPQSISPRRRNRQYDDLRSMSEANWSTQKPG